MLDDYDRRIRFLRRGQSWIVVPLSCGLFAVFMGVPGSLTSARMWVVTSILLLALWGGCRLSYVCSRAKILKKREQAARVLREIPEEDPSR